LTDGIDEDDDRIGTNDGGEGEDMARGNLGNRHIMATLEGWV